MDKTFGTLHVIYYNYHHAYPTEIGHGTGDCSTENTHLYLSKLQVFTLHILPHIVPPQCFAIITQDF